MFFFKLVNFLKKSCDQIYLSSYLDPEDLDIILKYHKDWLDFPVITYKESFPMEDFIKNLSNNSIDLLFIDGNIENLQKLSLEKPDYLYLLIKNSNFKCKDSFEKFKNPLIKPFLGFEDVDLNCFERSKSEFFVLCINFVFL